MPITDFLCIFATELYGLLKTYQYEEENFKININITDNTIFFFAPGQIQAFDGNEQLEGVVILFNASFLMDEESSESIFLKYNVFNAYDSLPCYKVTEEEAGRQLLHTPMSVKEIGYQLGFEAPSYFVKFFKRLTGKMPGEFRNG